MGTTGLCRIPRRPSVRLRLRLLRTLCSRDMEKYTIASKQFFSCRMRESSPCPKFFHIAFLRAVGSRPCPQRKKERETNVSRFLVGTTGLCRIPRGTLGMASAARTFALLEVVSHRFSAGCRFTGFPATKKHRLSGAFRGGDNRARTCDLMHVKHAL